MDLSKTVALTALLFIVVLIFTSAISFSAETEETPQQVTSRQ
jgi:hypothetical protein